MKEESEKAGLKLNIQKMKIIASNPITSWQIDEEAMETVKDFIFLVSQSLQMVTAAVKLKDLLLGIKIMTNLWHIKKQRHYFASEGLYSQCYDFSRSHVWM